jgi:hypothetical protein
LHHTKSFMSLIGDAKVNPYHQWLPLRFLVRKVYPRINYSLWAYVSQEAYLEWIKKTEAIDHKLVKKTGLRAVCILKSISYLVQPLLKELQELKDEEAIHELCVFLRIITENVLTVDEIKSVVHNQDQHKLTEFQEHIFYYYYYIGSLAQNSREHLSFVHMVHDLIILFGYILNLIWKSQFHGSHAKVQWGLLFKLLAEYVWKVPTPYTLSRDKRTTQIFKTFDCFVSSQRIDIHTKLDKILSASLPYHKFENDHQSLTFPIVLLMFQLYNEITDADPMTLFESYLSQETATMLQMDPHYYPIHWYNHDSELEYDETGIHTSSGRDEHVSAHISIMPGILLHHIGSIDAVVNQHSTDKSVSIYHEHDREIDHYDYFWYLKKILRDYHAWLSDKLTNVMESI